MNKFLVPLAFGLAMTGQATAQSNPETNLALRYCAGMPACAALVKAQPRLPPFLVACAMAFDRSEPDGPPKTAARNMCNALFSHFGQQAAR